MALAKTETYFPLTLELADAVVRERGISMDAIQPPRSITWPRLPSLAEMN